VARAAGTLLGRPIAFWREVTAHELGLPAGTVVGAGHQAEWWHPGILAKFAWAAELAARSGAGLAWLMVDTDVRDPLAMRVPLAEGGALRAAEHRFGPRVPAGTPPCMRSAAVPEACSPVRGTLALPCVVEGAARAFGALLAAVDATDAATQAWEANRACSHGVMQDAPTARTSRLLATTLGAALVHEALRDPAACARAFNEGAALVPRVARPLRLDGPAGPELPFWAPAADGSRMRLDAAGLRAARDAGTPIWPRAFLTGAIARAALCDRFVHGTGGRMYEAATERFMRAWIGADLPAFDTATATLRLPFPAVDGAPPVTAAERRRRWFDPHSGDGLPSREKREALARIAALPRASAERRTAWRAMHAQLAAARQARACDFAELEAAATADRARARDAAVRMDRTWAVALHPAEGVRRLAGALRSLR
jgi:hypothetical protein